MTARTQGSMTGSSNTTLQLVTFGGSSWEQLTDAETWNGTSMD